MNTSLLGSSYTLTHPFPRSGRHNVVTHINSRRHIKLGRCVIATVATQATYATCVARVGAASTELASVVGIDMSLRAECLCMQGRFCPSRSRSAASERLRLHAHAQAAYTEASDKISVVSAQRCSPQLCTVA